MNSYKTIIKNSEAPFKEKGSKFIGYAFAVSTEKQIDNYLLELKMQHPKATHHCTAFKLGTNEPLARTNDDGEPSNSAGKPILGQIESFELTNILIVVVRYYGGTKLGVGGLISAYKTAAKLAIEENEIVEKEITIMYKIDFPFDQQGIVEHLLKSVGGEILDKKFDTACHYKCSIPKVNSEEFMERVAAERTI